MSGMKNYMQNLEAEHHQRSEDLEELKGRLIHYAPDTHAEQQAMKLYRGEFERQHGYIFDGKSVTVADDGGDPESTLRVRGWGRISYMEDPEALQDAVGDIIAKALNLYWEIYGTAIEEEKTDG